MNNQTATITNVIIKKVYSNIFTIQFILILTVRNRKLFINRIRMRNSARVSIMARTIKKTELRVAT